MKTYSVCYAVLNHFSIKLHKKQHMLGRICVNLLKRYLQKTYFYANISNLIL